MKRILIILSLFLIHTNLVFAGGFPTLKLASSARSEAMGMAYAALADDASGGFWNPAGLSGLGRKDLLFSIHRWIEDVRGEFLAFGWGNGRQGFGIHVLYTDMGEMEHRLVASPTPLTTFSAHEIVLGFSYSHVILNQFSVGLTVQMLYEKIFIDEAIGAGIDLGFLWEVWEDGLRIGGVVQNIGKTSPMQNEDIQLPLMGRLGLACPLDILGGRFIFAVDGIQEKGFPFHIHGGMEYGWRESLFLRCGYQAGYETRDITGGLGVAWKRYRLDYCYMPLGSGLGDSHRLTIGIHW